ncbi:uncharacterized protein N7459_005992 [Penicillium hispanicum]|uniref:uncharacterized protein n=1 Tax=Penicillium hispanicum TaxID=1080232 RepID=UPI00253FEBEC|nr:uncharacterized protein N7459_005992 [Penicillium hispanicum]KAJ5580007.1 hypothetical protein N7459_005992 [Penicillium hispanicum]
MRLFCCSKGETADDDDRHVRPNHNPDKGKPATISTPTPPSTDVAPIKEKQSVKPDLWKQAFDSLPEDRKKFVPLNGTGSTTDAIEGVISQTTKKYREWEESGLKIKRKDGSDIDIRDTSAKILNAAMQAKDLVSALAAFDPTGKASAAWTIVSLGLTMISNNKDRRDAMFASSEYLAETLAYYAIVDARYRDEKVEGGQNFDRALLRVYIAILDYTAEVTKAQKESTIAIADQPLTQLKITIEEHRLGTERWADVINTLRNEEKDILKWVSSEPYSGIQTDTQESRASGTGNWLLESEEYKEWKGSAGSVLWLPGVVGCGKSVLCSTVIQDIETLCKTDPSKSLGYWYFQFEQKHAVDKMMRSLIRQLSRSPLASSVSESWDEHDRKGSQPNRATVTSMLDDVIASSPGDVFIVFDALDECPTNKKERQHLLALLVDLAKRHCQNIRVLATSRPEQDINAAMKQFPSIKLEERLAKDVETFILAELNDGDSTLVDASQKIKSSIVDALLNTGERRFRWADLQIKRLQNCPSDKLIEEALRNIPKDLAGTYQRILDKIEKDGHGHLARRMLMLLSFPAGPLDVNTVADSVDLSSPAFVLKICTSSLLSLSGEMVRLAHFSVKEYLVIKQGVDSEDSCRFTEIAARETLARMTVDLLLKQTENLTGETAMKQPFLVHAAIHWPTYVSALGDTSLWPQDLPDKVDQLFTVPTIYFNWVRIAENHAHLNEGQWNWLPEECPPPIYRASESSLLRTVDILVNQGMDPLKPYRDWSSPLMEAAEEGHLAVVNMLLRKKLPVTEETAKEIIRFMFSAYGAEFTDASELEVKEVMKTMRELGLMRDSSQSADDFVCDDFIRHAMMNQAAANLIMNELLDWRDTGLVSFSLPDNAVELAIHHFYLAGELLDVLFERCNDEISIPPTLFCGDRMLPYNSSGVSVLIHRRAGELTMSDSLIQGVAAVVDLEDMEFLLQARPDIQVTEKVLAAAAQNESGSAAVFRLLWARREPDTSITENLLCRAANNRSDPSVLQFLIDQLEPGTRLSESVIGQVLFNDLSGLTMMRMIMESHVVTIEFSDSLIKSILFKPDNTVEILELLVNYSTSEIPITETHVEIAAQNEKDAHSLINYLAQMQEDPIPVPDDALIIAIASGSNGLEILLQNYPDRPISDQVWFEACSSSWSGETRSLSLLLEKRGSCVPIDAIVAHFRDFPPAPAVLELLLDRKLVDVSETLLENVAGSFEALNSLLTWAPNATITHNALVQGARDPRSIRLLLEKRGNTTPITEDIIIGATNSDPESCRESIESIIRRAGSVPITKKVLQAALRNGSAGVLPWLYELQPDLKVPVKELVEDIWRSQEIPVDEKIQALDDFVELQGESEELSEEKLFASMLEIYPYGYKLKENYGLDEVVDRMFVNRGLEVPISDIERVAEIFVERCDTTTVETFLEAGFGETVADRLIQAADNSKPVTDCLIQAAKRNAIADEEQLISLLSKLGSD